MNLELNGIFYGVGKLRIPSALTGKQAAFLFFEGSRRRSQSQSQSQSHKTKAYFGDSNTVDWVTWLLILMEAPLETVYKVIQK